MKYRQSLIVVIILALVSSFSSLRAEIAPEKRAEIEKMLQLTGMYKLIDQMKVQMIAGFKTSMPDTPPEFWEKFSAKMDGGKLVEKLMPIYDKYYTVDDLRAVNAFYSSAAGQKILKTLPQVMREAMVVSQEWGREIGQEIQAETAAEAKPAAKPSGQ